MRKNLAESFFIFEAAFFISDSKLTTRAKIALHPVKDDHTLSANLQQHP
jgi:hypothetical protein